METERKARKASYSWKVGVQGRMKTRGIGKDIDKDYWKLQIRRWGACEGS